MLNPRPMGQDELADFLSGGEPTTKEFIKANIKDGFANTSTGVALDTIKEAVASAPDERASKSQAQENIAAFYDKRPAQVVDPESPQLKNFSLEDYKKSPYFREGVEFQDGWGEGRAKYLAEGYDTNRERELTLEKGGNGVVNTGIGFASQMIGGLADPINLIPFGGAASKGAKIGEKIVRAGIEGAVGNLAVSAITRPYWDKRGTDSDWKDYVNDVWIGGALGGGMGALGHAAAHRFRKADVQLKDQVVLAKAGDQAIESVATGTPLDLSKVEGLQKSYDSIYEIPEVQRSRKVQDMFVQLNEAGFSVEDAKTHIAPLVAHAEAFSRDLNMTMDEFLTTHGADLQKSELIGNGKAARIVQAETPEIKGMIDAEIDNMKQEIEFAQAGEKIYNDGSYEASTQSTFPQWFKDLGFTNKKEFLTAIENKTTAYDTIKSYAKDKLNGTDPEFQALTGYGQAEIPKGADGEPLFQSAYHGTPHKFDKFSTDKIGGGEGAQAYGWGMYFSSKEEVARYYKDSLSEVPADYKLKGKSVIKEYNKLLDRGDELMSVYEDILTHKSFQQIKDNYTIANGYSKKLEDFVSGLTDEDLKAYNEKGKQISRGYIHKVDLDIDEGKLLDHDKKFEDQSDFIKEKLKDVYKEIKKEQKKSKSTQDITGSYVYSHLSQKMGGDKATSLYLDGLGVDGLKYTDYDNRRAGKGDVSNYVVFKDSKVKIEDTYFKKSNGKERGAITFQDEGKAIIHLFENADESTIIHETGHLFLNNLEKFSAMENASPQLKADLANIRQWMGVAEGAKIETKHHEKFARGFEQFLKEGKAPRPELQAVFNRFKEWLSSIYKSNKDLKANLSDGARGVYSRLLGAETRPKIDTVPEVKAPEMRFKDEADLDAATNEVQAIIQNSPEMISPDEYADLSEMAKELDDTINAMDEVSQFFQSAKDDAALLEAANKVGMSKSQFEKIIDDFNQKLQDEDSARLGIEKLIEDKRIELAAEAKELKRQAFLALSARNGVQAHIDTIIQNGGSAKQSILSLIEGDSSLRGIEGAGKSVDGAYMALAQSTSSKCFTELRKIDPTIEKLFESDVSFNQNIAKEMMKPGSSGDKIAAQAGEILSRYSEEFRQRANLAGAKIGKLEGHVPRSHDVEKMMGKESEWVNFMMENLDPERSFKDMTPEAKRVALGDTFQDLVQNNHNHESSIDITEPLRKVQRNIAKKMGESRSLHFASPEAEVAYLKQFGQGENILESMSRHYENMSRKIALMERLGPNPDSTISFMVEKLRNDIRKGDKFSGLDDVKRNKILEGLGSKEDVKSRKGAIGNAMMFAIGEVDTTQGYFKNFSQIARAVNSLSKLGSALLSQPGDFVHAVNERRLLSDTNEAGLWIETFKDYFHSPSKELSEVMDHVGIYVDGINFKNFNKFDGDNINNKLSRANDLMFRYSGQNWHVKHSKQAAGLSLAREMGSNISKSWNDIHPGLKEMLVQYGSFNETKWNMIQNAKAINVEGKDYFHPGLLDELSDDLFEPMLPDDLRADNPDLPGIEGAQIDPAWKERRDAQIKRERFKLETDLKTFFVEESRNAAPEPDAKVRRIMSGGKMSGTKTSEAIKLLTQFKTFAFVNFDRSIKGKRMMKDSKDYGGLVHHAVATLALGYISTLLKDLAKGIEPADPTLAKTWGRAAMQSGGLGIAGDFFGSAYSARSGSDVLSAMAGPTVSTISNVSVLALKGIHGETYEDGSKYASKWVDFARSIAPAPFSSLWYTRAAMDHLVWQNLKETLEPGSIRRSQKRLKKEFNQKYIVNPQSTQWLSR